MTATVVNTRIGGSAFADTVTVTLVIENPPNLPTIKFRFNPGSKFPSFHVDLSCC